MPKVSKSSSKSKHKHQYSDCLVKFKDKWYGLGSKCIICDRLKVKTYMVTEKKEGYYVMLEPEQILEKYKDLPIIEHQI